MRARSNPAIGTTQADDSAATIPSVIAGRFPSSRLAYHSSASDVYFAEDSKLRRTVAVKVKRISLDMDVKRCLSRHIRHVASLQHPRIVQYYDAYLLTDRLVTVQSFLAGGTLQQRIASAKGNCCTDATKLFLQVCDAVRYLHSRRLVHRDLKPSNILFDEQGNACLADLDLLCECGTVGGMLGEPFVGTFGYAAPELLDNNSLSTIQSEIYALGIILFEMLSGRELFSASRAVAAQQTLDKRVPELEPKCVPNWKAWDAIIRKCTAGLPSRRYQDVSGLMSDVENATRGNPISARRSTRVELAYRSIRAAPALSFILLLALCCFIGVTTATTIAWQHSSTRLREFRTSEGKRFAAIADSERANIELENQIEFNRQLTQQEESQSAQLKDALVSLTIARNAAKTLLEDEVSKRASRQANLTKLQQVEAEIRQQDAQKFDLEESIALVRQQKYLEQIRHAFTLIREDTKKPFEDFAKAVDPGSAQWAEAQKQLATTALELRGWEYHALSSIIRRKSFFAPIRELGKIDKKTIRSFGSVLLEKEPSFSFENSEVSFKKERTVTCNGIEFLLPKVVGRGDQLTEVLAVLPDGQIMLIGRGDELVSVYAADCFGVQRGNYGSLTQGAEAALSEWRQRRATLKATNSLNLRRIGRVSEPIHGLVCVNVSQNPIFELSGRRYAFSFSSKRRKYVLESDGIPGRIPQIFSESTDHWDVFTQIAGVLPDQSLVLLGTSRQDESGSRYTPVYKAFMNSYELDEAHSDRYLTRDELSTIERERGRYVALSGVTVDQNKLTIGDHSRAAAEVVRSVIENAPLNAHWAVRLHDDLLNLDLFYEVVSSNNVSEVICYTRSANVFNIGSDEFYSNLFYSKNEIAGSFALEGNWPENAKLPRTLKRISIVGNGFPQNVFCDLLAAPNLKGLEFFGSLRESQFTPARLNSTLTDLSLRGDFSLAFLDNLLNAQHLERLRLAGSFSGKVSPIKLSLPKLRQLNVGWHSVFDEDYLNQIVALPSIETLTIESGTNSTFEKIGNSRRLKTLTIGRTATSTATVESLRSAVRKTSNLTLLCPSWETRHTVVKESIVDRLANILQGATQLRELKLAGRVGELPLKKVQGFTELRSLALPSCELSGIDVSNLCWLTHLNLSKNNLNISSIRGLDQLASLESLMLAETRTRSPELMQLARNSRLQTIDLFNAPVNITGIRELVKLPHLKKLVLVTDDRIPLAEINKLKFAHPQIEFDTLERGTKEFVKRRSNYRH